MKLKRSKHTTETDYRHEVNDESVADVTGIVAGYNANDIVMDDFKFIALQAIRHINLDS